MKRKKKKNNENLVCIVHYPNKDESKYTDIKKISAKNEERIRLAKSERETYTDQNIHREQFTLILAKSKEKLPKNSTTIWKIIISSRKRDIGLPKRIWVMFGVSCIRI